MVGIQKITENANPAPNPVGLILKASASVHTLLATVRHLLEAAAPNLDGLKPDDEDLAVRVATVPVCRTPRSLASSLLTSTNRSPAVSTPPHLTTLHPPIAFHIPCGRSTSNSLDALRDPPPPPPTHTHTLLVLPPTKLVHREAAFLPVRTMLGGPRLRVMVAAAMMSMSQSTRSTSQVTKLSMPQTRRVGRLH